MTLLAIFIGLLFLYSLVSKCFERTILTSPILFTAAGVVVYLLMPQLHERQGNLEVFLRVAEIGLVLLLFTDASRTDLGVLKSIRNLPVRLLSAGMLLTILLGALGAFLVLPNLSIFEAGILSAILAPTDAGLGQVIVNSPRVPQRIRQALNVEAGLNDGLSVPFLLFFIGLGATQTEAHHSGLMQVMIEQLGIGTLLGLGIGLVGGWLLGISERKQWTTEPLQQLGAFALPLLCAMASEPLGASMFIAAFVAGLAVQVGFREAGKRSVEFAEDWGQLFNLCVFFLFGLLVARNYGQFRFGHLIYAILSLTVVRMVPVGVSLIGTGLSRASVVFMGWFGPRGLASIVLGLVYLEHQAHLPGERTITLAVMVTVLVSIFAHGMTAMPGIGLYASKLATLDSGAPEHLSVGAGQPEAGSEPGR